MSAESIVRMANQIATAQSGYPEAEAVAETAKHIKYFWDPRMRRQLADLVAHGGAELSPIAFKAAQSLPPPK